MLPKPRVYSPRATRTKPSVVEWVIQQKPASVPLSIRANQPLPAIGEWHLVVTLACFDRIIASRIFLLGPK